MPSRRTFLQQAGWLGGLALFGDFARGAVNDGPHIDFPAATRERIAVASYPFRDFIDPPPRGEEAPQKAHARIPLKDFAAHVKSKFKVNKVELWTGHFPSSDAAYLSELRHSVDEAEAKIVNLAVDGEHSPYSPDADEREQAIAFSKHWIDAASSLGSSCVRTNLPDAKGAKPNLELTAASLKQVADYAATRNVVVHLENDNPISEDPLFLVQLVEKVNSPWLHTLPDFANTLAAHNEKYAYEGISAMFSRAYAMCHVKAMEVNHAGKTVHVDMARTFGFMKNNGYRGFCSMEFDSPGDPYAGTAALIDQTLQYLG